MREKEDISWAGDLVSKAHLAGWKFITGHNVNLALNLLITADL